MSKLLFALSTAFIMATIVVAPLGIIDSNSTLILISFGLGCVAAALYTIADNISLHKQIKEYNYHRYLNSK